MAESSQIWLQRTLASVAVGSATTSSAFVCFAQISANSVHKVIPRQVK